MTLEQIKEELSNNFVGILASSKGFKLTQPKDTGGVDFTLTEEVLYRTPQGHSRHIQSGKYIDIQLKSTTESSVIIDGSFIKYDLEVKTYNDLILRRTHSNAPLYLILFVLPTNQENWIEHLEEELILRKFAFWYLPESGDLMTENASRIRIKIPISNKLKAETFDNWFSNNYA